jgi:hypothetical protein
MATLKGVNRTKYDTANGIIDRGEQGGRVLFAYDEYTLSAVLEVADVIQGPILPKGARVIEAEVSCASLGTTGIIDLGWEATLDENGDTLAADPNGFIDGADAGGQAVHALMSDELNFAGNKIKFGADTQVSVTCTEISTNDNVKIKIGVWYILD